MSSDNPNLIPSAPMPPKVPVVIEEETVLDQDAITALQRQGFVDIPVTALNDLKTLGVHIHQLGTIRTQRGSAIISQFRLESSMKLLFQELTDLAADKNRKDRLKAMLAVSQQIGYLSGKFVDSQTLLVLMEGGSANITPDGISDNTVPSFRAGAQVKPSQTLVIANEAHLHQPPHNPR